MEISFATKKMQKTCASEKECIKTWGAKRGRLVMRRLLDLSAAECLADVSRLPPVRCHELHQNREGQLGVLLEHPYRLVFEPAEDPIPAREDGGLDWVKVKKIRIIEVVDYHG